MGVTHHELEQINIDRRFRVTPGSLFRLDIYWQPNRSMIV